MTVRITRPEARGFTLLEAVIAIGLVSAVLVIATMFAAEFAAAQAKAAAYHEAQRNARLAANRIEVELREAAAINMGASAFGTDPGTLSLQAQEPLNDPTVFTVSSGTLYVQQGAAPAAPLTSPEVEVRSLVFDDLSVAGRSSIVRATLTLGTAAGAGGLQDVEAEVTVRVSGRVRIADGFSN